MNVEARLLLEIASQMRAHLPHTQIAQVISVFAAKLAADSIDGAASRDKVLALLRTHGSDVVKLFTSGTCSRFNVLPVEFFDYAVSNRNWTHMHTLEFCRTVKNDQPVEASKWTCIGGMPTLNTVGVTLAPVPLSDGRIVASIERHVYDPPLSKLNDHVRFAFKFEGDPTEYSFSLVGIQTHAMRLFLLYAETYAIGGEKSRWCSSAKAKAALAFLKTERENQHEHEQTLM
jgi:hypothetical protein